MLADWLENKRLKISPTVEKRTKRLINEKIRKLDAWPKKNSLKEAFLK